MTATGRRIRALAVTVASIGSGGPALIEVAMVVENPTDEELVGPDPLSVCRDGRFGTAAADSSLDPLAPLAAGEIVEAAAVVELAADCEDPRLQVRVLISEAGTTDPIAEWMVPEDAIG